jgi:hypothetical protein
MGSKERSRCEWLVLKEGTELAGICGRPPLGVVFDTFGDRHFACRDHLPSVKAWFGTGAWSVRTPTPPPWPYPESRT